MPIGLSSDGDKSRIDMWKAAPLALSYAIGFSGPPWFCTHELNNYL